MRKGPEEENSSVHFAKQDEDRVAGVGGGHLQIKLDR